MPKDYKALRALLTGIQTQLCSTTETQLEEPFRTTFKGIKAEFDTILASLPAAEAVVQDVEAHLQSLWTCFNSLNLLFTTLTAGRKAPDATALNSAVEAEIAKRITAGELFAKDVIPVKVKEQVASLTTAGELVPKETVTQLCADAKANGITEGETKVRNEIAAKAALDAKVAERKTALQTAGHPIPDADVDKLLGGTDEEFAAHKARMETQLAEFGKKGIQLNSESPVRAKAWLAADQFKGFLALTDGIPALKSGGGEPFAGGGNTPGGVINFPV